MQFEVGKRSTVSFDVGPAYVGHKERRIPHSLNARLHWAARHRWNKAWKESVQAGIWENKRRLGRMPYSRAKVVVTLHTMRLLDMDNAYTCVKPVVDALTLYGVIVDDRMDCIDLAVQQVKVSHRHDEKVTLTIERTDDGNANGNNQRAAA